MFRINMLHPAAAILWAGLLSATPVAADNISSDDFPPTGTLRYTVMRNGDEIGTHEMQFVRDGNRFKVLTDIDVAVTFAGIRAFHFAIKSDEEWVDGRLASFVATSDDNGKVHHVRVEPGGDGLWVTENGVRKLFPQVSLIGTLWNPATARQSRLIDPVDGKLRLVSIADHGLESVTVQGRTMQARHISIAGKMRREVWYGPDGRIVHFEFRTGDDSLIVAKLR
jgi:hypothetical protein